MVTIQGIGGKMVVLKGERKVVPSCLTFIMTAGKLIRKGCHVFLAHVKETKKESVELANILIVREYPDVFPEELPGLPPVREIEVLINTFPETSSIAQSQYRMTLVELVELKVQLQELLDKRFIRHSNSP